MNAGRKGLAYLRDYYHPPATADAVAPEIALDERTLVGASRPKG